MNTDAPLLVRFGRSSRQIAFKRLVPSSYGLCRLPAACSVFKRLVSPFGFSGRLPVCWNACHRSRDRISTYRKTPTNRPFLALSRCSCPFEIRTSWYSIAIAIHSAKLFWLLQVCHSVTAVAFRPLTVRHTVSVASYRPLPVCHTIPAVSLIYYKRTQPFRTLAGLINRKRPQTALVAR